MTEILHITNLILLVIVIAGIALIIQRTRRSDVSGLLLRVDNLDRGIERAERTVREEAALSREELGRATRDQRHELVELVRTFGDSVANQLTNVAAVQKGQLADFSNQLAAFAKASGDRLDGVRAESAIAAKQLREEVVSSLSNVSETITTTMNSLAAAQKAQLEAFANQLTSFARSSNEKLDGTRAESTQAAKQLREEIVATLTSIAESTRKTMSEVASQQKLQLEVMTAAITNLSESNQSKLEAIRITVEGKLQVMQAENAKQLEQMRQTVDEKLQGTLEKRLGESFKQVSERLEQVHKGLGEMQTLAAGVGDLKKVLTNVKTRGTWGEVQLGNLLEQVLSPDQFAANVATKNDGERVEYAIKLPGQDSDQTVWLPIDAKFPIEDYQRLVEAEESGDVEAVEASRKQLENRVKACAREISKKYLNPPNTTDFGILFLPVEGLFAEVIRRTAVMEIIQRECRVVVAGPTTLWSILNSLQMGFRTLAIQKRSSEVWNLLAAVKTEWTKYGDVLDVVQKKLHQASETIENAKIRSRAVGRKLSGVQELPVGEANALLAIQALEANPTLREADAAVGEE